MNKRKKGNLGRAEDSKGNAFLKPKESLKNSALSYIQKVNGIGSYSAF